MATLEFDIFIHLVFRSITFKLYESLSFRVYPLSCEKMSHTLAWWKAVPNFFFSQTTIRTIGCLRIQVMYSIIQHRVNNTHLKLGISCKFYIFDLGTWWAWPGKRVLKTFFLVCRKETFWIFWCQNSMLWFFTCTFKSPRPDICALAPAIWVLSSDVVFWGALKHH